MGETTFTPNKETGELVIERTFNAPIEKVWEAFTDPDKFVQWWGPRGWNTTLKEAEFKDGGWFTYGMKCEDPEQKDWYGQESWGKMVFSDLDEPNGFKYTDYFCDENGVVNDMLPVTDNIMKFTEEDGKTRITSIGVYKSAEDLQKVLDMGMEEGLKQTWDRLEEYLR